MDILGTGKAIDLIRDIFSPVGETLSEGWAGLIGDRIAHWRVINAMKYQSILSEEATRLGLKINLSKISDKYAYSWFEEATKQSEPEIQLLFARLLARAADEDSAADADRRLIDILARLTPEDALLFQRIYSDKPFDDGRTHAITHDTENGWLLIWFTEMIIQANPKYNPVSLDNLVLQGCLKRSSRLDFTNSGGAISEKVLESIAWGQELSRRIGQKDYIEGTQIGSALYAAVKI